MSLVFSLLSFIIWIFFIVLIGRLVLEWVQVFARDWRPRGASLVVAESVYTVTDPPLKGLRRVVRPIRIGSIQLDLAFLILALGCQLAIALLDNAAASTA